MADLNFFGKLHSLKERFETSVIISGNSQGQALTTDMWTKSTGEDFAGIVASSLQTSSVINFMKVKSHWPTWYDHG